MPSCSNARSPCEAPHGPGLVGAIQLHTGGWNSVSSALTTAVEAVNPRRCAKDCAHQFVQKVATKALLRLSNCIAEWKSLLHRHLQAC